MLFAADSQQRQRDEPMLPLRGAPLQQATILLLARSRTVPRKQCRIAFDTTTNASTDTYNTSTESNLAIELNVRREMS